MKSTYKTFLANLRTIIEGIDPNIGTLFDTHRIWKSEDEIKTDGAIYHIQGPSALELLEKDGEAVTRFWFAEVKIEPAPLTNCSSEYRTTVTLTGFYAFQDDNSQQEQLRDACIEILDALNDRTVQNITLNTGDGYLGFLEERPKMGTQVELAEIGNGTIAGHAASVVVTYFEEIPY